MKMISNLYALLFFNTILIGITKAEHTIIDVDKVGHESVHPSTDKEVAISIANRYNTPSLVFSDEEGVERCKKKWDRFGGFKYPYKGLWDSVFTNEISKTLLRRYFECQGQPFVLKKQEFIYLLPNMSYLKNLFLSQGLLNRISNLDGLRSLDGKDIQISVPWISTGGNFGHFKIHFYGKVKIRKVFKHLQTYRLDFEGKITLSDTYDFNAAYHRGDDEIVVALTRSILPGNPVDVRAEPMDYKATEYIHATRMILSNYTKELTFLTESRLEDLGFVNVENCFEGQDYPSIHFGYSKHANIIRNIATSSSRLVTGIKEGDFDMIIYAPMIASFGYLAIFGDGFELLKAPIILLGADQLLKFAAGPHKFQLKRKMTLRENLNLFCDGKTKADCCPLKGAISLKYRGVEYCKCPNGPNLPLFSVWRCFEENSNLEMNH